MENDLEKKEELVDNLKFNNAKTRKGSVILKKREGEYYEESKKCLYVCSNKRTELLKQFMQDIYLIQKPLTCYKPKVNPNLFNILTKLNLLVDMCIHNSCSFFFCINGNKNNSRFLIGRLYNNKILDYYLFSLLKFIPLHSFKLAKEVMYDTKPIVLIQGSYFDQNETNKYVKNVLFDFFKHRKTDALSKESIQRLIVISAYENKQKQTDIDNVNEENIVGTDPTETGPTGAGPTGAGPTEADPTGADPTEADPTGADPTGADPTGADPTGADPTEVNPINNKKKKKKKDKNKNKKNNTNKYILTFRQYLIKSEYFNLPEQDEPLTLDEIGPRFDFQLEECKIPEYNTFVEALKKPNNKENKNKIKKKIKVDELGNDIKKVYVQKQNFSKLHTKHSKSLKKWKKNSKGMKIDGDKQQE
ncbi:nucleolar preribosomal assembly protein, putative [Hepatocystis sp. ex Piliocolobus tephrosceles]|nr:nucleolar preribosomal assembly protein, putative [Hepatocystis sp. ex Piliocolobus tephrosceles]